MSIHSILRKSRFLAIISLLSILFACNPTRHLEKDERLLNKVKVNTKKGFTEEDDLLSLAKQKPNRAILGFFKLHLGVYNLYYNKENSRIKDKIGEPPVVYDSTLNDVSANLMKRYLQNNGYYESEVSWSHKLRKRKAKVWYSVVKGVQYKLVKVDYKISNPIIRNTFLEDSASSKIKVGEPFSVELMKAERTRIEKQMKNAGYYRFSREFVVFEADTFRNSKTAAITLNIKNEVERFGDSDSLIEIPHLRHRISRVIVRMNYSARETFSSGDSVQVDSITFVHFGDYDLKRKVLSRLIYIRPGDLYSLTKQEETYGNLSALKNFNYVSIHYEVDYEKGQNHLIAFIDLNPRKQKSYTIQTEGTNNGGNLGINANVSFQNNNTFNGAEILSLRLTGGLEAQQILTKDDKRDLANNFLPFNTYELGPEISLEVPRFLLPINTDRFSPRGNPRTTFNASYNFQERPDYIRNVSKVFIAYSWNETPTKTHIIQPIDLSFIKLKPSPAFKEILNNINNPFLRNSYTDNFILALKYSFIYNTQSERQRRNNYFFRFNAESSGNLLSAITSNSNFLPNEDGTYNIAGVQYTQYLRSDIDIRFYQQLLKRQQMVYRFSVGLGIPYGNSKAMPFEKSFYAGGANGIRAWRARELGPGSLPDSMASTIDQIGNMKLELNFEYRFPISGILEGAAFLDAGNIWNVEQEDSRPNTEFNTSTIWKATAIGVGGGLRLNFTFFILRFDIATPIKDPSIKNPYAIKALWGKSNLNLGIGYPF